MKEIDFTKYKAGKPTMKPNKINMPINNFGFNQAGIDEFNDIYRFCLEQEAAGNMRRFVKTKSGGISIARNNIRGWQWMLNSTTSVLEIVIRYRAWYYRFIIGYNKDKNTKDSMWGRKAFNIYRKELAKDKVCLEDLAIENGEEVKATIPKQKIELFVPAETTYYNAFHADLNSAYNAGMAEAFPVLRPTIERMYAKRKENAEFKNVLNMTQGVMQSALTGYRFSHISKAGYVWTNNQIDILAAKLKAAGYRILSYNADGIWYKGEKPYEDETFGNKLGQWKNDHVYCKIRYKSKGSYEYESEADGYVPVVRGETTYERIKSREDWTWGDIFKGDLVKIHFEEGVGLVRDVNY